MSSGSTLEAVVGDLRVVFAIRPLKPGESVLVAGRRMEVEHAQFADAAEFDMVLAMHRKGVADTLQLDAWRSVFAVGEKCRFRLPESSPVNPGWYTVWGLDVRRSAVHPYFELSIPRRRSGILTVVDSRPVWL
jgi:hypothetical protein